MGTPYLGEIKIFSFNFAPKAWAFANGQTLSIQQNTALFSLLGTTFGGNGQSTFQLPDLRSRIAIGAQGVHTLGEVAGVESHVLTQLEMPAHTHPVLANTGAGTAYEPAGSFWAQDSGGNPQFASAANVDLSNQVIPTMGGNQPHSNIMPYLTLNFCIALQGIFPSRN